MANTKQATKRVRQIARRTEVNTARRSRIRSFIRKVDEAIEAKDKKVAEEAFKALQPEFMRGVTKGIFHKNTVSRKLSRLSGHIKAL